jgi:hypothetical protein
MEKHILIGLILKLLGNHISGNILNKELLNIRFPVGKTGEITRIKRPTCVSK